MSKDYVRQVADSIIKQIEQGTAPWMRPWKPGERFMPYNPSSGHEYRGMNAVYLMAEAEARGFKDKRWLTFNQAKDSGANVKKGERGTLVQFWKWRGMEPVVDADGKPVVDNKGQQKKELVEYTKPRVFGAVVFNAEQIEGLAPPEQRDPPAEWERHATAEAILNTSGAKILHEEGNHAFYSPGRDEIVLPERHQFGSADDYYGVALHELGHWTGHPTRLARDLAHPFGSEGYAKEELRAEIASMMLGDHLGTGHDPNRHAAYIKSWVKVLQDDPREIFRAASDADRIKTYVVGLSQEESQALRDSASVNRNEQNADPALQAMQAARSAEVQVRADPASSDEEKQLAKERRKAAEMEVMTGEGAATETRGPNMNEKTYLAVPFGDKDTAKRHGARWDREAKSWFAPAGVDLTPLAKWLQPAINPDAPPPSPQEEFTDAVRAAGLLLDDADHSAGQAHMDGEFRRVRVEGDHDRQTSGAYVGFMDGHPAGYIQNYKTGFKQNWKATGASNQLSDADRQRLTVEAEENRRERQARRDQEHAEGAARSEKAIATASLAPADHAYLIRKGFEGNPHALKVDEFGNLMVPGHDIDGKVWTFQRVPPEGEKRFAKDTRAEGSHFLLTAPGQTIEAAGTLLIAEGYITAATLQRQTGLPVVAAFSKGNLLPVALDYREKYPGINLVIAGDNDHRKPLEQDANGKPKENAGKVYAEAAAAAVGGYALLPSFDPEDKGSDWNDYEAKHGHDATKKALREGLAVAQVHINAASAKGTAPLSFSQLTPAQQDQVRANFSAAREHTGYAYTIGRDGKVVSRKRDSGAADQVAATEAARVKGETTVDTDRRRVAEARRSGHNGQLVAENVRLDQAEAIDRPTPPQTLSNIDTVRNAADAVAEQQDKAQGKRRTRTR